MGGLKFPPIDIKGPQPVVAVDAVLPSAVGMLELPSFPLLNGWGQEPPRHSGALLGFLQRTTATALPGAGALVMVGFNNDNRPPLLPPPPFGPGPDVRIELRIDDSHKEDRSVAGAIAFAEIERRSPGHNGAG